MDKDEDKDKHILQKEEKDGGSNTSILQNMRFPNYTTSGYGTNNEHKSTADTSANQFSGDEIESGSVQADQWIKDRVFSSNERSNADEDSTSSQSLLSYGEVAQVEEDQLAPAIVSVSGNITNSSQSTPTQGYPDADGEEDTPVLNTESPIAFDSFLDVDSGAPSKCKGSELVLGCMKSRMGQSSKPDCRSDSPNDAGCLEPRPTRQKVNSAMVVPEGKLLHNSMLKASDEWAVPKLKGPPPDHRPNDVVRPDKPTQKTPPNV